MSPVTLITGCRSGFGRGFALGAARAGHTVYAGLRDLATADALMADAAALPSDAGAIHPLQLDVTRADERDAAVARVLAEQGRIDGLVNNAGIALGGFLEQVSEAELRKVFDVNVFAVWAMTRAVLPTMRDQRSGTIVQISSLSGLMAFPGLGVYASSKFALEGMSEAWRHELAPFGVRVYLIEPGPYQTDIWERNRRLADGWDNPDSPWAPYVRRIEAAATKQASEKVGDPEEVVERVIRLLNGGPRPLRHPMGPGATVRNFAKRHLPFSIIERAVARVMAG